MRASRRAAARPRRGLSASDYASAVDTTEIGIAAAALMDELAERLDDDAEVAHVTLVAVVEVPEDDAARPGGSQLHFDQHVYWQSTAESRLEQIGTLATATSMAIGAEPEE